MSQSAAHPKRLFLDDAAIEEMQGVHRAFHAFQKAPENPVVWGDRPWEKFGPWIYGTVLFDEPSGLYRMWYQSNSGVPQGDIHDYAQPAETGGWRRPNTGSTWGSMVCYAISRDGLRWEKPELGLVEWNGSRANNIVWATGYLDAYDASIILDLQDPDPARRYKMYHWDIRPTDRAEGMWLAISPDGLHWQLERPEPLIREIGDVLPTVFDEQAGRFMSFTKIEVFRPGDPRYWRSVGVSLSPDGLAWSPPQLVLEPDEADIQLARRVGGERGEFYGLAGFPYEGLYLGLLWVFRIDAFAPAGRTRGWDDGPFEVQLAWSQDGLSWQRPASRFPVIPPSPPGCFDAGTLSTANRPLVTDDQILLYYSGSQGPHGCDFPPNYTAIGLASLRRDGFASLSTGPREGVVLTRPFELVGSALELNIDASRGYARVELTDAQGNPLTGHTAAEADPITGDHIRHRITWNGHSDLSSWRGQQVRLRVTLRHTDWYAFRDLS